MKIQQWWKGCLMSMGLVGLTLNLLAQSLWFTPTVLLLYGDIAALMILTGGLCIWMGERIRTELRHRASSPFGWKVWQLVALIGHMVIWPSMLAGYWVFLSQVRLLMPDTGLLGLLAQGSFWIITAGVVLLTIYAFWLLVLGCHLLLELLQHPGDHHHAHQKRNNSQG
ncbi:hypothetical protein FGL86_05680 [Pistricoccus aurantiacus]|uniref:Uncharacterized protein n=1 Tax=Pistricoccus aurantiacus TaxID=1883414 RepID=A0A5B8SVB0_9GAMM|nr:hypothetical protein [Pistricoccus aurantiacus]QEA38618.1 hypothetical protein FGL86_05680 [Pistricoccus aurantiacus]